MPMRCRVFGETEWREVRIENISRTGILFRAERVLEPDMRVEMSFVLPVEITGRGAAEVHCTGRIVRSLPRAANGGAARDLRAALAAKILEYRFVRCPTIRQV